MFTGSTETGKKVVERAARDAHAGRARARRQGPDDRARRRRPRARRQRAAYYSMQNSGQTCISVERVYVEEPVYDEFVAKVDRQGRAPCARAVPGGPGSVDVGAIIFPPQLDIVEDHVKDAVDKGARVLAGGHARPGGGRFYEPTVLVDVDHTMKCMTEETFGPTLPIMKVERCRRGGAAGQRLALRAGGLGVDEGRRARRGDRPADRGRRGVRQRRADQLHRARAADGRLEGRPGSARATAPAGSASTARSRRSSSRASRPRRTSTCSRTRRATSKPARPACSSSCTAAASATNALELRPQGQLCAVRLALEQPWHEGRRSTTRGSNSACPRHRSSSSPRPSRAGRSARSAPTVEPRRCSARSPVHAACPLPSGCSGADPLAHGRRLDCAPSSGAR